MDDLQKNYGKLIQNLDRIQPLWSTSLKKELGTILKIRLQLFITYMSTDLGSSIETFIVHMLLIKNPHFLPNDYETRSTLSTHK